MLLPAEHCKILLAFDSFKGSVSSSQAADAARGAILSLMPGAEVRTALISDGGEDFMLNMAHYCGCREDDWICCPTVNPLGSPIEARYFISGGTAVMDVASASGLTLLSPAERNPMLTSSLGTGMMILDAMRNRDCRDFLIGLGGSATCDAAMGILSALGYRCINALGGRLEPVGANLAEVAAIDSSCVHPCVERSRFTLACDVTNPFCGPNGAACVFAPQKGATSGQVEMLDSGLSHFAEVVKRATGKDISEVKGAGAAGGIAGTLHAMLRAEIKSGMEIISRKARLADDIAWADLVFTGEGAIDAQSCMGKLVGHIVRKCHEAGVPVVALGGCVDDAGAAALVGLGAKAVFPIHRGPIPVDIAMRTDVTLNALGQTVASVIGLLQ